MPFTTDLAVRFASLSLAALISSPLAALAYDYDPALLPASTFDQAKYDGSGANVPIRFESGVHNPDVELHRVTVDLSVYPEARCNDGSPAVFYFREGSGDNDDKFVIFFEGGGGCTSADSDASLRGKCTDRWKDANGLPSFDHGAKMTTDWNRDGFIDESGPGGVIAPLSGKLGGIFSANSVFSDWNRIAINYCSSDNYRGQSGLVDVAGVEMYFNGRYIVRDIFDMLEAGDACADSDATYCLPVLDDAAARIILAGDSAGSGGVGNNLDDIAGRFAQGLVWGVMGASVKPDFAYDQDPAVFGVSPYCTDPGWATYDDPTWLMWDVDGDGCPDDVAPGLDLNGDGYADNDRSIGGIYTVDSVLSGTVNAFNDASCVVDEGVNAFLCHNTSALIHRGHISTRLFVKQDLEDGTVGGAWDDRPGVFAQAVREGLTAAAGNPNTDISFFGPKCHQHESMKVAAYFDDQLYDPVTGKSFSYDSAIGWWLDNPTTFIRIYDGMAAWEPDCL